MNGLQTHLGFSQLRHTADCAKPAWEVEYLRRDGDRRRYPEDKVRHHCTADDDPDGYAECRHQDTFLETVVRLVCRSCSTGFEIKGEGVSVSLPMPLTELGLDPAPRRVAGYWLHAGGAPHRLRHGEPEWLLVTTSRGPLAESDIVGEIYPGESARGGLRWSAVAGLECNPKHLGWEPRRHSWKDRSGQTFFKSQAAAVRWIDAQLSGAATDGTAPMSSG